MAVVGKRVTVQNTATLITQGQGDNIGRFGATIKNIGGAAIDLGGSGVTTGAGYQLAVGEAIDVSQLGGDDAVYGITSAGTVVVVVLEII